MLDGAMKRGHSRTCCDKPPRDQSPSLIARYEELAVGDANLGAAQKENRQPILDSESQTAPSL
jgi:hypothetical protein